MTDREQVLETAREIMLDAHCRYCDVAGQDPRLKCSVDIQNSTRQIVDELLEAEAQGVERVMAVCGRPHAEWIQRCVEIAAELRKQKGGAK